jgi:uncharacterized SAM-binding protein YcdF (DUF218 family)
VTIFEIAAWFGFVMIVVVWCRRQPVPYFGSLTMYRRGGGSESILMPSPARYRAATRAQVPFFDGVVVPSARGADELLRAARTARNAGAPLVVLASGRTDAAEAERLLGDDNCLVLDTPT